MSIAGTVVLPDGSSPFNDDELVPLTAGDVFALQRILQLYESGAEVSLSQSIVRHWELSVWVCIFLVLVTLLSLAVHFHFLPYVSRVESVCSP